MPEELELKKSQKIAKALEAAYLLDRRHKKRRPWTSLIEHLVGRGRLNLMLKAMYLKDFIVCIVCWDTPGDTPCLLLGHFWLIFPLSSYLKNSDAGSTPQ